MTIVTPSLLPEAAVPATGLAAPAGADAIVAPGDSFDLLMAAELPAIPAEAATDASPDAPASEPATEQASVLAACLVWTPAPLTVPPPTTETPSAPAAISANRTGDNPFQPMTPVVDDSNPPAVPVPAFPAAPTATNLPRRTGVPAMLTEAFPDDQAAVALDAPLAPRASADAPVRMDAARFPLPAIPLAASTDAPAVVPSPVGTAMTAAPATAERPARPSATEFAMPEVAPVMTAPPLAPPPPTIPVSPTAPVAADAPAVVLAAEFSVTPAPVDDIAAPVVRDEAPAPESGENPAAPAVTPMAGPTREATALRALYQASGPVQPAAHARQEKNAEWSAPVSGDASESLAPAAKTFVSHEGQEGRVEPDIVGTHVAKPAANMPSQPSDQPLPSPLTVTPPAAAGGLARVEPAAAHAAQPVVQEAVAKVLSVVDAQQQIAVGGRRSVAMDFDFGGERLAVRVEFRDGGVRAHFQTGSPELRAALESEWSQAVAARGSSLQSVQPEFVATGAKDAGFANADGGASRQHSRQPAPEPFPASATNRTLFERPASVSQAAPENLPRLIQSYTTRHLHTFA